MTVAQASAIAKGYGGEVRGVTQNISRSKATVSLRFPTNLHMIWFLARAKEHSAGLTVRQAQDPTAAGSGVTVDLTFPLALT